MPSHHEFAIVTGASSGIGQSIALRLANDGYHLILNAHLNRNGIEETLGLIRQSGGRADVVTFDVTQETETENALDSFLKSQESTARLQVLVNNAGIHRDNLTGLMSTDEFDEVIKTNVYGPFFLMRWAVKKMIRQRSGSIVNIASLAGQTGNAGQVNYAASKAALIAMTKSLAREVGARGVRVNAVAPGLIETPMLKDVPHLDMMKSQIPLGRIGTPAEVAGAVSFLCSADASYVSGHTLSVNGGLFPT